MHHFLGQILHVHGLSLHFQLLFGRFGLGHNDSHNDIEDDNGQEDIRVEEHDPVVKTEHAAQHGKDNDAGDDEQPQQRDVDFKRRGQPRQHAGNHLVFRIAIEATLAEKLLHIAEKTLERRFAVAVFVLVALKSRFFAVGFMGIGRLRVWRVVGLGAVHFLGLPDARDDLLHVFDVHGLHALPFQFVKQFSDALLDVVGNFAASLLFAKIVAQRLGVVPQQFVGILVDVEKSPTQIDGDVLFHIFRILFLPFQYTDSVFNLAPRRVEA